MRIITGGSGTGKTTKLVEIAGRDDLCIVCSGKNEAINIMAMAQEMEFPWLPYPLTYYEFARGEFALGKEVNGILIDNVDRLLQYMAQNILVKAVTLTVEGPLKEI